MVPMAPSSTRMRLAASCRSSASTGESFGVNSAMQVTRSAPSPRKGEGWAEGVRALVDGACSGSSPRHHPCFPTRRCPRSAGRDSPWLPGPRFLPCPVRSAPRAARHRAPRSREHLRKQNRPRSDRSAPADETSNRRGGGRADGITARVPRRSGRGAGVGLCRSCLSCPCPLTPTLSPLGRGSAPSSLRAPCAAPPVRTQANPLAPPLPGGKRSAREARRVRGQGLIESHLPPHPNPLPCGERERAESAACSCRPLLVRTQGAPLAPPLPGGERSAREAGRVRGQGLIESHLPPHPNPLPCGERERAESAACSRRPLLVRTQGAPLAPPLPGGERSAREARRVRGQGPIESHLPPHPNPLPCGDRGRAESAACSCRPLLVRTQGAPLAPPLPGGERSAREARPVRGQGPIESHL